MHSVELWPWRSQVQQSEMKNQCSGILSLISVAVITLHINAQPFFPSDPPPRPPVNPVSASYLPGVGTFLIVNNNHGRASVAHTRRPRQVGKPQDDPGPKCQYVQMKGKNWFYCYLGCQRVELGPWLPFDNIRLLFIELERLTYFWNVLQNDFDFRIYWNVRYSHARHVLQSDKMHICIKILAVNWIMLECFSNKLCQYPSTFCLVMKIPNPNCQIGHIIDQQ